MTWRQTAPRRWPAIPALLVIVTSGLLAAIIVSCLPEDPYRRFQQLDNTEYRNLRWIYERTHFDARPIDVAILGSSRIASGVDARLLEASLRSAGRQLLVENLGIPYNGRNLDLEIAQQLLSNKQPQIMIVGITERPSRHTHVAFKYVASSSNLFTSYRLGNIDYLSDLIYLPYRHIMNFLSSIVPKDAGSTPELPTREKEAETAFVQEHDGHWLVRYPQRSLAELRVGARRSLEQGFGSALPRTTWGSDWSLERRNIVAIADLARMRKVKIVFLFIPQFMSEGIASDRSFYQKQGLFLDAGFFATHPEYYSSWGHLNAQGAAVMNTWLYRQLADRRLLQNERQDRVG